MSSSDSSSSLPRRLARSVRHAPDRLLHRLRRRQAVRRLRELHLPASVLFICHGNICRSPYAAAALRRDLPEALQGAVEIESAGLIGPGRPGPREALSVGAARGVDLSAHRSASLLSLPRLDGRLAVVMNTRQRASLRSLYGPSVTPLLLGDLDPERIDTRTVRDPVEQPAEVFDEVYTRIDRCIRVMVEALQGR